MLEGLPSLFNYVVAQMTVRRQRDSLPGVIYHLLGDVTNAAQFSLSDYLVLNLDEPYLKDSSCGTPYQKWALGSSENFEKVDKCMRRLMTVTWHGIEGDMGEPVRMPADLGNDAWHWFFTVIREYTCCVIMRDEPFLILSEIHLGDWVDSEGRFFPYRRSADLLDKLPPPIVTKSVRDIRNRSAVRELRRVALERLGEMREANGRFADWLRENYTMEEITAPHEGTLSDSWLGSRAL